MFTADQFRAYLEENGTLIVDGGLATELETRGHDLKNPLWSAKLLRDNPEAIQKVHLDYFLAGADIAVTASYQASIEGFHSHFGLTETESVELIRRSVQLARKASDEACNYHRKIALVAGSVGPYGAFLSDGSEYRGDYKRSKEELQTFHRPRIQALIDTGVNLLAIETMPQLTEIEALLEMLRDEFPGAIAWVSCTLADSGHISDGTCLEQVLRVVNQYQDVVVAFGVNCVPVNLVTEALQLMKRRAKLPLLCYPNSGEVWDAETKTWSSAEGANKEWAALVSEWYGSGARLIGGCCRTGLEHVLETSTELSQTKEI